MCTHKMRGIKEKVKKKMFLNKYIKCLLKLLHVFCRRLRDLRSNPKKDEVNKACFAWFYSYTISTILNGQVHLNNL